MAYVPPHRRRRPDDDNNKNSSKYTGDTFSFPRISNNSNNNSNNTNNQVEFPTCIRCINLAKRTDKWQDLTAEARRVGGSFFEKLTRLDAVDGGLSSERISANDSEQVLQSEVALEWDSTKNAQYSSKVIPGKKNLTPGEIGCALSHIALWRELAATNDDGDNDAGKNSTMMVLEDDASFTKYRGKSRFAKAYQNALEQLPDGGWDILYLGFSDRGERLYLEDVVDSQQKNLQKERYHPLYNPQVRLFRPEYGFHTHAYVLRAPAATTLLSHLPVVGPLDVWLADNQWFGLQVFCAVIANEGWRNDDGTYEGALLVRQDRGRGKTSDVAQSASIR